MRDVEHKEMNEKDKITADTLKIDCESDFKEWIQDNLESAKSLNGDYDNNNRIGDTYILDRISEIADSCVPIYNYDKMKVIASDLSFGYVDDSGLIEGVKDIFDFAGRTIYENLNIYIYENYENWINEVLEKQ